MADTAKAPQAKANENDPTRFRRNGPQRKKPPEKVPERVVNLFQASGATPANASKKAEPKASSPAKTSAQARPNARRRLNRPPEKPATDTQASEKKTPEDATKDETKASNKPQTKTVNERLKGLVKQIEERMRATAKKDQDSTQADVSKADKNSDSKADKNSDSKADKNSDSNGVCFYVSSLRERSKQQFQQCTATNEKRDDKRNDKQDTSDKNQRGNQGQQDQRENGQAKPEETLPRDKDDGQLPPKENDRDAKSDGTGNVTKKPTKAGERCDQCGQDVQKTEDGTPENNRHRHVDCIGRPIDEKSQGCANRFTFQNCARLVSERDGEAQTDSVRVFASSDIQCGDGDIQSYPSLPQNKTPSSRYTVHSHSADNRKHTAVKQNQKGRRSLSPCPTPCWLPQDSDGQGGNGSSYFAVTQTGGENIHSYPYLVKSESTENTRRCESDRVIGNKEDKSSVKDAASQKRREIIASIMTRLQTLEEHDYTLCKDLESINQEIQRTQLELMTTKPDDYASKLRRFGQVKNMLEEVEVNNSKPDFRQIMEQLMNHDRSKFRSTMGTTFREAFEPSEVYHKSHYKFGESGFRRRYDDRFDVEYLPQYGESRYSPRETLFYPSGDIQTRGDFEPMVDCTLSPRHGALAAYYTKRNMMTEVVVVAENHFDLRHRKATLYEKALEKERYGLDMSPQYLPKPGQALEERITGLKEGHPALVELLMLERLQQVGVLLRYLGDECKRLLKLAHREIPGCQNMFPGENLDTAQRFSVHRYKNPENVLGFIGYSKTLQGEIDTLMTSYCALRSEAVKGRSHIQTPGISPAQSVIPAWQDVQTSPRFTCNFQPPSCTGSNYVGQTDHIANQHQNQQNQPYTYNQQENQYYIQSQPDIQTQENPQYIQNQPYIQNQQENQPYIPSETSQESNGIYQERPPANSCLNQEPGTEGGTNCNLFRQQPEKHVQFQRQHSRASTATQNRQCFGRSGASQPAKPILKQRTNQRTGGDGVGYQQGNDGYGNNEHAVNSDAIGDEQSWLTDKDYIPNSPGPEIWTDADYTMPPSVVPTTYKSESAVETKLKNTRPKPKKPMATKNPQLTQKTTRTKPLATKVKNTAQAIKRAPKTLIREKRPTTAAIPRRRTPNKPRTPRSKNKSPSAPSSKVPWYRQPSLPAWAPSLPTCGDSRAKDPHEITITYNPEALQQASHSFGRRFSSVKTPDEPNSPPPKQKRIVSQPEQKPSKHDYGEYHVYRPNNQAKRPPKAT